MQYQVKIIATPLSNDIILAPEYINSATKDRPEVEEFKYSSKQYIQCKSLILSIKNTKPCTLPLYNPTLEQLREYIKERQAADIAAAATAQVEEKDTEENNEEVLAIIEHAGGEGKGGNENKGNNKDIFETIEAFKE